MRSYYAHLETTQVKPGAIASKPVFRSSAIFPVFQERGITSRILFMGYWILKRNIKEIASVITLRASSGQILTRTNTMIQEPKTYTIELSDQLSAAGLSTDTPFTGSLEVEFFSTVNMVFPFPATVINYYGPNFCTVVHTAQRVYNDFDDMRNNSQTKVPESGFNIYADEDREPFLGFINGAEPRPEATVSMQFFNSEGEALSHEFQLGNLAPYETRILFPDKEVDLKKFLKGKVGAAKASFQLNWIFPRLIVGNFRHSLPAISITHSYYDCSKAVSESDYWQPDQPKWHPATLMIPLNIQDDHFTNICFYPIYSPSTFGIDIEIYNNQGKLLGSLQNALKITSPKDGFDVIKLKDVCKNLGIQPDAYMAARIIAHHETGSRIPARIKTAVDIGKKEQEMPCNICTNLQPFNPKLEDKPKSFRWGPILADQPFSSVWIMNSAPDIDYQKHAEIDISFHRHSDANSLSRNLRIPPHGFLVVSPNEDEELKAFFDNKVGWFTLVTNNPYITTYYFAENPSGVVGGDHGF